VWSTQVQAISQQYDRRGAVKSEDDGDRRESMMIGTCRTMLTSTEASPLLFLSFPILPCSPKRKVCQHRPNPPFCNLHGVSLSDRLTDPIDKRKVEGPRRGGGCRAPRRHCSPLWPTQQHCLQWEVRTTQTSNCRCFEGDRILHVICGKLF
jgi:hypothetical protein